MHQLGLIMRGLALVYHAQLVNLESNLSLIYNFVRGHQEPARDAEWGSCVGHVCEEEWPEGTWRRGELPRGP